ncbi:MAG: hypothetical protein Q8O67_24410 [Deltaproteobacteria bacterium]|nr:hypothetical protein [Deltaproteobacteria bacterium]
MTITTTPGVRTGTTNGVQASSLSPSKPIKENAELKGVLKDLKQAALDGGASATMFLPSPGIKYEAWSFSYHTGLSKEMNLNVKEGTKVQGHIAINISGHAGGGRAEQVTALAMEKLASDHGVDLSKTGAKNDALFAKLLNAAQSSGYADATLKVEGLPEIKLTAAEVNAYGATDEGKWAGGDVLKRQFAMTNSYNVRVTLPDGQRLEMSNVPRGKVDQAEYSTKIPIEFPAMKGNTIIEAWPSGSAGVAGYTEARQYKAHIGAENFYSEEKGIDLAEKYMDAHPQVRWAARAKDPDSDIAQENEEADLKKTGVHPLPLPYGDSP